jgi:hypothetical protein
MDRHVDYKIESSLVDQRHVKLVASEALSVPHVPGQDFFATLLVDVYVVLNSGDV